MDNKLVTLNIYYGHTIGGEEGRRFMITTAYIAFTDNGIV